MPLQWLALCSLATIKCLNTLFLLSSHLCFIIGFICNLSVTRNDSRMGSKTSSRTEDITKTCLFKYTENSPPPSKNENFQIKKSDIFHISAENIDCGYSLELPGDSNEYPQSMFSAEIRKIMYTPVNPSFTI